MRELKHLPLNEWPEADCAAFRAAYEPGDVFDGTSGPGAHLSEGTRKMIEISYRRWLGFLKANYPNDLSIPPAERIKPERVRSFIERLRAEVKPITVVIAADLLYTAAKLLLQQPIGRGLDRSNRGWLTALGLRIDLIGSCPLCKRSTSASSLWTPRLN